VPQDFALFFFFGAFHEAEAFRPRWRVDIEKDAEGALASGAGRKALRSSAGFANLGSAPVSAMNVCVSFALDAERIRRLLVRNHGQPSPLRRLARLLGQVGEAAPLGACDARECFPRVDGVPERAFDPYLPGVALFRAPGVDVRRTSTKGKSRCVRTGAVVPTATILMEGGPSWDLALAYSCSASAERPFFRASRAEGELFEASRVYVGEDDYRGAYGFAESSELGASTMMRFAFDETIGETRRSRPPPYRCDGANGSAAPRASAGEAGIGFVLNASQCDVAAG